MVTELDRHVVRILGIYPIKKKKDYKYVSEVEIPRKNAIFEIFENCYENNDGSYTFGRDDYKQTELYALLVSTGIITKESFPELLELIDKNTRMREIKHFNEDVESCIPLNETPFLSSINPNFPDILRGFFHATKENLYRMSQGYDPKIVKKTLWVYGLSDSGKGIVQSEIMRLLGKRLCTKLGKLEDMLDERKSHVYANSVITIIEEADKLGESSFQLLKDHITSSVTGSRTHYVNFRMINTYTWMYVSANHSPVEIFKDIAFSRRIVAVKCLRPAWTGETQMTDDEAFDFKQNVRRELLTLFNQANQADYDKLLKHRSVISNPLEDLIQELFVAAPSGTKSNQMQPFSLFKKTLQILDKTVPKFTYEHLKNVIKKIHPEIKIPTMASNPVPLFAREGVMLSMGNGLYYPSLASSVSTPILNRLEASISAVKDN